MFDNPLHPHLLQIAYGNGFFPMPHPHSGEIHWFNPDPRAVLPLDNFYTSKSLRRSISNRSYTPRFNHDFRATMEACAARPDTWITPQIIDAYVQLHQLKTAHSVEIYHDNVLVGGLYGLAIGASFFAESMFHHKRDASKVALYYLVEHLKHNDYDLLEVQFMTPHLSSLGAVNISQNTYLEKLRTSVKKNRTFFATIR
jgi:leucyl/phenylalanyl-tRNA---protein transferase